MGVIGHLLALYQLLARRQQALHLLIAGSLGVDAHQRLCAGEADEDPGAIR
jgi:hypothetical protein